MLTSRNAIALTISLAVISLLWSCWSLLQPPDGDGLRADSYGTRGRGQRAVFDTFRELGLPIRRSLGPPISGQLEHARLVLWQPSNEIVNVEQNWLEGIGTWVREGGHVLVAVGVEELNWFDPATMREAARQSRKKKKKDSTEVEAEPRSLWELLQIPGVSVKPLDTADSTEDSTVKTSEPQSRQPRELRDIFDDALKTGQTTSERTKLAVRADGVFESLLGSDRTLSLPVNGLFEIHFGEQVPVGKVTISRTHDAVSDFPRPHPARLDGAHDGVLATSPVSPTFRPHPPRADGEADHRLSHAEESDSPSARGGWSLSVCLPLSSSSPSFALSTRGRWGRGTEDDAICIAARFSVGRGEVTVVSVPALIENSVVGEADNIVVLSQLLTDDAREIVFDEFYHGLAIRGNPMWLFAQRTYGAVTLMLLLVIGLLGWRESVFLGTPLAERPVSRRAIREYVDAMARFLREGRGAGAWILSKLRDGVLWHLRREHGLPPDQHSDERLLAAVERRDPDRAAELSKTLQAVQSLMAAGRAGHEHSAIPLMRRMVECLSKSATARCATKSPK